MKLKPDQILKRDAKRLWIAWKKKEKDMSPWINIIMNPDNWNKLDIRVQQKNGKFKRLVK